MSLEQMPLLSLIKGRMQHLGARQKLIAENVANADTAGFTPRDLKPFTVADVGRRASGGVGAVRTHAMHIGTEAPRRSPYQARLAPGSETTLDGNSVVLEEEMIKMAEARTDYDAAIGLYQKSLTLLRMAARAPGR
jgi:flagellar basal-body rod protein FlgB